MKFTRMFILKALNADNSNSIDDPVVAMREVIVSNSNIDFLISFSLSLLALITSFNSDYDFTYQNPINFYLIIKINFNLVLLYFTVVFGLLSLANVNSNSKFYPRRTSNSNSSERKSNKLFSNVDFPKFFELHWHFLNALFHFIQNILFIYSFGLSVAFWVMYTGQKPLMDHTKYLSIHIIIIELYEFYALFRFCFFLLKVAFNFLLIPMYASAIYLGHVEDKFNFELNQMVNTKEYDGRRSSVRKSDAEEYCSICLNGFQIGDTVSTLPCSKKHMFHTFCLEKWFYNTVSCPLCRSNFSEKLEELVPVGARRNDQNVQPHIQMEDMNNNPFEGVQ